MTVERKKAGVWPWIAALLIGLPVLYVASFGPVCWITSPSGDGRIVNFAYRPVIWIWDNTDLPVGEFLLWYSKLGAAKGWIWPQWNVANEESVPRWEHHWECQP